MADGDWRWKDTFSIFHTGNKTLLSINRRNAKQTTQHTDAAAVKPLAALELAAHCLVVLGNLA